ncbi:uncharacterized protein Dwil_GK27779 [Drosophila willistoni]|uniref:Single domain-containing protein n=1 Tax=Drosophila willistoni TaxID=7260 RepID=A0A0Q9WS06_DROWI|nr:uncharacterized protein LOC26529781 [Drosophila willistoni]KRF98745.1 uncharacterized protein Dwil_GK27779 [Drosophila willistoni]
MLILICIILTLASQSLADLSVNNYADSAYPGRCVLDVGHSVILLNMAQSYKFDNLPCTQVFCIGDGWGMLNTCDREKPPDDCRYTEILDWDAPYPECCKRRVVCD